MNYRPYPEADRALAQVKRGRLPELPRPPVIASLAQLQAYVESGEFARRMLAIGETFSAVLARRSGKSAITAAIVDQPVKAGEHVHVAGRDGVRCAGRDQACRLSPTPRLANDDEVTDAD
ncbi:hypothetical protein AB0M41_38890 [Streptomyces sp. NPDC051896]|uniref:hypothetical protein n=1 Tax=Streptomyces sp. NPDC051896 TaxID=3155416 RepID=UPI003433D1F1